jgi:serine/threonine protein kinase
MIVNFYFIVLLDEDGHLALTDFGLAKYLKNNEMTNTFVGIAIYYLNI